ncbi:MAG: AAA family ATPase, partial [Thermodesulfobacteriota bacterium]|nr:AAA family ATPase [Thermodesulfobacteriota bacterium]
MMKINAFKLLAYGPFTDKVLDFSSNDFGLHVVFGLNEAGKSTALRALIGLFYGFGHIVEDDWLHDYNKLAVGASLNFLDGEVLNLSRYKRRKNDLINDNTGEPFEQTKLDLHLGKMGRENFEHAFGISHYSLRQGVESVLAAGGDLGHALFAATSGLNTLKQVTVKLEDKHNQLFTPRKQKGINADISQLNKLRKEQRDASAGHRQWKKMKKQLDDLQQREVEGVEQVEALGLRISLLSRYRDALKFVSAREQLEKDLADLGVVPDLPDDFSQHRVATQVAIKQSRQAEKNLTQDLADIHGKLEKLTYDEKIIANEKLIKALADEAHVHARATADSKDNRAKIYQHNETAQQALDLLRPGLTLDSVQALRLSKPEKSKIQRLGAKGAKSEESADSALKALRLAEANLKKAQAELDQLEKPRDTSALADCLTRAAEYGKLEERLADARVQVALAKEQADADLAALGLWAGDISELERLALPTEETMRSFETDLTDADQKLADTEKEIVRIQEPLKEKEKALSELTETRDLPSIDDLRSHRNLRDRGWQSVRTVWLKGGDTDQGFMATFPESSDLAGAYEKSVARADNTADVLRDDADAVARAESLRTDIRHQKESLKEIKARQEMFGKDRAALWTKWVELWKPLGIDPLKPREMTAWAGKAGELRRKASDLRERQIVAVQLQEDIDRIRSDVATALEHIAVNIPEKASYSAIIELAKRIVKHND